MQQAVLDTQHADAVELEQAAGLPPFEADLGLEPEVAEVRPRVEPERPSSRPTWLGTWRVSVVVPTLNEARNLVHVLPRIPTWVHEVLLVDGHSTDDTVAVAHELLPSIRVVQQRGKGKGDALRTGFDAATGDIIVMIDADGSTDPGEIPAFIGAL